MPDIIEENEGEGRSAIELRAIRAQALAQAARARRSAAAAARDLVAVAAGAAIVNNGDNNNNNNNNNNAVPVAVAENEAAAAPNANENPPPAVAAELAEVGQIAGHMARLTNVDVRPMFRRLGVRRALDIRYIRERDLDGIPRITQIQKRKLWAIMKFCATIDQPFTGRTTLADIAKALNLNKKKEKEGNNSSNSSSTTSAALVPTTASGVVPIVHVSKLDSFDGNHFNWVLWKNKARYSLAQTAIAPLLNDNAEEAQKHAKKNTGIDHLFFNMLAEAIVGGNAKHLIRKAVQESQAPPVAAAADNNSNNKSDTIPASGRALWMLLHEEYSQGPRAFWILSDARQVLQKLRLVGPDNNNNHTAAVANGNDKETALMLHENTDTTENNENRVFMTCSANSYAQRFRSAKETLEEFNQALPDQFLASTFIEHIEDDRLETIKKQLLQDITTKNLSLDACITELLMSDHMLRARQINNRRKRQQNGRRKRTMEEMEDGGESADNAKRPKLGDDEKKLQDDVMFEEEPDEATS
ncbi:expressed unknown protein [Seminavis robusta]|uniref:Uncharacterized protein n=1 Tax=Seminavis robusta TaxID=568900 RepID=A0A9N8EDJ5_9STRA|nr:expressed unknown protein [Seminavis robusta]|eukprot:Sro1019_g232050.1 n/a (529) ;mRNA; r:36147-37733